MKYAPNQMMMYARDYVGDTFWHRFGRVTDGVTLRVPEPKVSKPILRKWRKLPFMEPQTASRQFYNVLQPPTVADRIYGLSHWLAMADRLRERGQLLERERELSAIARERQARDEWQRARNYLSDQAVAAGVDPTVRDYWLQQVERLDQREIIRRNAVSQEIEMRTQQLRRPYEPLQRDLIRELYKGYRTWPMLPSRPPFRVIEPRAFVATTA